MKFLTGMACVFAIAASGVYLARTASTWSAERKAQQAAVDLAAIELCLNKRAEAAKYAGGMDWTGADNIKYATADAYCR